MVVRWWRASLRRSLFVTIAVALLLPPGSGQESSGRPLEGGLDQNIAGKEGGNEQPSEAPSRSSAGFSVPSEQSSENSAKAAEPSLGSSENASKSSEPASSESSEKSRSSESSAEEGGREKRHGEAEPLHSECYYKAHPFEGLVFFFTSMTVGTFIMFLTMFPTFHGVQQTVVIYALGMIYALLGEYYKLYDSTGMFGRSYCMWMNIDPHLLLFSMLPALITGDAMSIDTAVARRVYRQCIHLAGPGVLFSSVATALFLWWYLPYNWSFLLCLTVGSILAATDPVAVVNLLKDLGASPTLTVQIQGESLLNDGTAMVLYSVTSKMLEGEEFGTNQIIFFLLRVVLAACVVGALLGWCCTIWIRLSCRRLDDHATFVQISITLLCAYWSYILADGLFGMSGVLTTVSSALVLADRMWPSIVSKESMDNAWHMFEFMGNTAIFFLAGSWTGSIMYKIEAKDYLHLLVIYGVCNVVRGAMLIVSLPVMRILGEDIKPVSLADCAVMCWGGLRGAVGLSLAIHLSIDRAGGSLSKEDGTRVLFFTSGIAALTLLVNATTCPLLVKWLGIARTSKARVTIMKRIHYQLVCKANARTRSKPTDGSVVSEKVSQLNDLTGQIMDGMLQDVDHHISGSKASVSFWGLFSGRHEHESEDHDAQGAAQDQAMQNGRGSVHLGMKHSDSSVMSNDDGPTLLMHHDSARRAHQKIDEELLELLRFPRVVDEDDGRREELFALVTQSKPHKSMHRLVREAFLSLLKAQYWEMNNKGEFLDDQEVRSALVQSLGTISESNNHLISDLRFIVNRMMSDGDMTLEELGYVFDEDILHLEKPEEKDGKEGRDMMGCCARVEDSNFFWISMYVVVCVNSVTIAIELMDSENGGGVYMPIINLGFSLAYIIEFMIRFGALKWSYFCDAWNVLDFTLLLVGLAGIVLEFMMMNDPALNTEEDRDDVNQSQSARIARFVKIFRVLRNVRIAFRVVLALLNAKQHGLARRMDCTRGLSGIMAIFSNLKNSDQTVARVRFVHILSSFVKAHLHCQQQFINYFGKEGKLQSTEAARCLLDSRTEVFAATVMAVNVAGQVDKPALEAVYVLSDSNRVAEELLHFVEGAHTNGILGAREAETLQTPLKHHMSELTSLLHRAVRGEFGGFKDAMSSMVWFQRVLSINPIALNRQASSVYRQGSRTGLAGLDHLHGPGLQEKWEKKATVSSPREQKEEPEQWSVRLNDQAHEPRGNGNMHKIFSWSMDGKCEDVANCSSVDTTVQQQPFPSPPSPPTSLPPSSLPGSPLATPRCPTPPCLEFEGTEAMSIASAYYEKG